MKERKRATEKESERELHIYRKLGRQIEGQGYLYVETYIERLT